MITPAESGLLSGPERVQLEDDLAFFRRMRVGPAEEEEEEAEEHN